MKRNLILKKFWHIILGPAVQRHPAPRRSLLFRNACTEQDNPEVHYDKSGSSYNKTAE